MHTIEHIERADEHTYIHDLLARILRECPERAPTSPDERRSQEIVQEVLEGMGLETELLPFEFNDSLYKNLALHFGLGSLGTLVSMASPALGVLLHGGTAVSYWAETTRRGYLLRRLFKFHESQNLLATMPAKGEPDLRVVFLGHADAAHTGILFNPQLIEQMTAHPLPGLGFLRRSLEVATKSLAALAGIDLVRMVFGRLLTLPLRPLECVLTVPPFVAFLLAIDVVIRNRIVPGANDNLSAVVALPILASRLAAGKPDNVEYVFGVTGCEEASLGGADALAHQMEGRWDKRTTVVVVLDSISNGDLNYIEIEGEVVRTPIPDWLNQTIKAVAASEPRFAEVEGFEIPVGGSDAAAFLARGWDSASLTCVDHAIGSPREYHQPTDDLEHLDLDKLLYSIDFAEKLTHAILDRRLDR